MIKNMKIKKTKSSQKPVNVPIYYNKYDISEISELIAEYSNLYQKFEDYQRKENDNKVLLSVGDQKTGVIGEYYAAKYIQNRYCIPTVYSPSSSDYDIEYTHRKKTYKIQVKAVSAHSITRTISPIKNYKIDKKSKNKISNEWDELYLLSLNEKFILDRLWIIPKGKLNFNDDGIIASAKMPEINNSNSDNSKSNKITKIDINIFLIKDFKKYV